MILRQRSCDLQQELVTAWLVTFFVFLTFPSKLTVVFGKHCSSKRSPLISDKQWGQNCPLIMLLPLLLLQLSGFLPIQGFTDCSVGSQPQWEFLQRLHAGVFSGRLQWWRLCRVYQIQHWVSGQMFCVKICPFYSCKFNILSIDTQFILINLTLFWGCPYIT